MPPIRDKFTIHSTALVCLDADLKGAITIGPGAIIHPKAALFALSGPILIGANTIIEEGAVLINRRRGGATMRVGEGTLVEVGARVECSEVGEGCVFGARCRVGAGLRLGRGIVVGPGCLVLPEWEKEKEGASAGPGAGMGAGTRTSHPSQASTTTPTATTPGPVDEDTSGTDEIVPDYTVFYGCTPGRAALGCVGIGSGGVGVGVGNSSSPHTFNSSHSSPSSSSSARGAVDAINALNAGPSATTATRRVWSGRGRVQEMDLRRKHAEYLREMLPKFNRQRKGEGQ